MLGVVRFPSLLLITTGSLPSITATQLLVVPRSIPMILLIFGCCSLGPLKGLNVVFQFWIVVRLFPTIVPVAAPCADWQVQANVAIPPLTIGQNILVATEVAAIGQTKVQAGGILALYQFRRCRCM